MGRLDILVNIVTDNLKSAPCCQEDLVPISAVLFDISTNLFWTLQFEDGGPVIDDIFFVQTTDCFGESFPSDGATDFLGKENGNAFALLNGVREGLKGNFCDQWVS